MLLSRPEFETCQNANSSFDGRFLPNVVDATVMQYKARAVETIFQENQRIDTRIGSMDVHLPLHKLIIT